MMTINVTLANWGISAGRSPRLTATCGSLAKL